MKLEVLVAVTSECTIDVRWREPLGRPGAGMYRALEESLEELHGVEHVRVARYSAEVEIAPHVASADDVAGWISEELADPNSEFQVAARFHFQGIEIDVANAGRLVRL